MAQLVTRVSDELLASVDDLVARRVVGSRSEAVRIGLRAVLDRDRRHAVASAIIDGYRRRPQSAEEVGWPDEASASMIAEEPW